MKVMSENTVSFAGKFSQENKVPLLFSAAPKVTCVSHQQGKAQPWLWGPIRPGHCGPQQGLLTAAYGAQCRQQAQAQHGLGKHLLSIAGRDLPSLP